MSFRFLSLTKQTKYCPSLCQFIFGCVLEVLQQLIHLNLSPKIIELMRTKYGSTFSRCLQGTPEKAGIIFDKGKAHKNVYLGHFSPKQTAS